MSSKKMDHEIKGRVHPLVPEVHSQLLKGQIDRRDFLRTATLLGVSASAAYAMSGAIGMGEVMAQSPKKGGILRCSMEVQEMTDPAKFA